MRTLSMKNLAFVLTLALAAVGMEATAAAKSLLAFGTYAGNDQGSVSAFAVLSDGFATSLPFTTTKATKLIKITYNAECGSQGPLGSFVSVTILVDGNEANPQSGKTFAMCSSNDGFLDWKGASVSRSSVLSLGTTTSRCKST